jgi:hypothetical protein
VIKSFVKAEGTSVMKRVVLLEIGEFRRDWNRSFLFSLTVEDLRFMTVRPQGGGKISQADRLCPDRGTIEISYRWLDQEDLHLFPENLNNYIQPEIRCPFLGRNRGTLAFLFEKY